MIDYDDFDIQFMICRYIEVDASIPILIILLYSIVILLQFLCSLLTVGLAAKSYSALLTVSVNSDC